MACGIEEADIEEPPGLQVGLRQRRDVEVASSSTQNCQGSAQRGCTSCGSWPSVDTNVGRKLCMKCKTSLAVVAVRQKEPLCADCAYTCAQNKVRAAMRLRIGVEPDDCVAVCLSGGSSSRAMLHLLQDIRSCNKHRHHKGKITFDLLAIHVEEGCAHGMTDEESARSAREVWQTVEGSLPAESYTCAAIEDVFLDPACTQQASRMQQREHLQRLLAAVPDATGREDLIESLRSLVLLSVAARLGANKLARGDSSTKLAMRVLATAAKGAGYALPSKLHFLDSRHGLSQPVWISPVRELTAKDLAMLCHFWGLRTAQLPVLRKPMRQPSINALAEAFVAGLQATLPSTVNTVLGTACKLEAFPWNTLVGSGAQSSHSQAAQVRPKDVLCPVCSAPLDTDEQALSLTATTLAAACCRVCQQQIFGTGSGIADAARQAAVIENLFASCILRRAATTSNQSQGQCLSQEQLRQKLDGLLLDADN